MDIFVKQGSIVEQAVDLVVVNLFQGVTEPGGATGAVDKAMGGAISAIIAGGDFVGKPGETALLYTRGAILPPRVLVVGLGEQAKLTTNTVRATGSYCSA